jgi:hypothetical protein
MCQKSTTVIVKLTPKSIAALHAASARTGFNMTDSLNRSIQFYEAATRGGLPVGGFWRQLWRALTRSSPAWR